jgi:hypothetical protein
MGHEKHMSCFHACVKEAPCVLGHDSITKWAVGAPKGWQAMANKLLAICYQNNMSDCENTFKYFITFEA